MATKHPSKPALPAPLRKTLDSPRNRRLLTGFAISVAAHAAVMLIHFSMPERAAMRAPSLDVILVNARHNTAPKDPQALGQANLDGGGNSDENVRIASPLLPQESTRDGNDLVDMQRQQSTPQKQEQQNVLTREGASVSIAQMESEPDKSSAPRPANGADAMDAAAMARQLEGEIAAKTEAYNKRPRKKALSASVQEDRFALYMNKWKTKVERIGELNYPAAARGKLYGDLLLVVAIRRDGTVDSVNVERPSPHEVLNEAAKRIVRLGEPYEPFPPDIARDTDIIEINRIWLFTNDKLITRYRD